MSTLDALLVALSFRGCDPARTGSAAWRADCPLCGERDALALGYRHGVGLSLLPCCGCSRSEILADLGVEVEVEEVGAW